MKLLPHNPKYDEVLQHSISIAPNFTYSPQEFYEAIERELVSRKVPGLDISRVEYAEGGLLADKRVYLRMVRERLAFDACAAPFGIDFFFACRTVYSPVTIKLWHVFAVTVLFAVVYSLLGTLLGAKLALVALIGLIIALGQVLQNPITFGLTDLDKALLNTPALGPIYERLFRKDTYYRQDTRFVFLEIVPKIIEQLVEDITAAKGVKLVRQYERSPILNELYKPVPPKDKSNS